MTPQQKKKINMIAALIVLVAIIAVIVSTCSGSEKSEESVAITEITIVPDSLLAYLNKNANLQDGMSIEVAELDSKNCRVRVTVPEQVGKTGADVVGSGICTLTAQYLAGKGQTVGYNGIYTSCYVCSPYVGTIAKPDMVTKWGYAKYDANTDAVKWTWENN